jgi:protein-S-isoprenylcysteine O-methyltransferase Ste14
MTGLDQIQAVFYIAYAAGSLLLLASSLVIHRRLRLGTLESVVLPLVLVSAGVRFLHFYSTGKAPIEIAGVVIAAVGAALGVWSFRHLGFINSDDFWLGRREHKPRTLVATGPYRYIRHPLYVSLLIEYLGVFLVFMHPLSAAVYAAAVLYGVYMSATEETFLAGQFPQYAEYQAQTGRFVPKANKNAPRFPGGGMRDAE